MLRDSSLAIVAVLASCGGPLSQRSHAETSGEIAVGAAITKVRIEIENGRVDITPSAAAGTVAFVGGIRRAADTPEQLAVLEQVPFRLTGAPDPADPTTLVIRGPRRPAELPGAVFAVEANVRVPPELPLELTIEANGDVIVVDRRAPTRVATGRGDLRFENCAGGVVATTGRGVLIAFGHRGDLDVQTKTGDMQAFVVEPGERIQLVTGQGTVQCQVNPAVEFDLDARAEIGKIGNGFGLEPQPGHGYSAALVGKRGSARTKVVLRTGSGHLSFAPLRSP